MRSVDVSPPSGLKSSAASSNPDPTRVGWRGTAYQAVGNGPLDDRGSKRTAHTKGLAATVRGGRCDALLFRWLDDGRAKAMPSLWSATSCGSIQPPCELIGGASPKSADRFA